MLEAAEEGVDTEVVAVAEQEGRGTEVELFAAEAVAGRYVTVKKRSCCAEMPTGSC